MRIYQFKDLFGNFGTVSMLQSAISNESLPNFILMSGASGTGKSSSAEIVSLALTCENRQGYEPCLQCESCKTNLAALQGDGISSSVKKVNLGLKNDKKDVDELISEVFMLDRSYGKSVFILEEVHSLDDLRQTSLLEEIDKLSKNVYVILCTTQPKRLLDELTNRAINFRFSNLKSSDSRLLLEKVMTDSGAKFSDEIKDLILKKAKGTPRVIVSLVEFLKNNNTSFKGVLDFLGEINPQLFNMLLRSTGNLNNYYLAIDELINDYPVGDVIYSFKKYLLDLQFLSKGVSTYHSNTTQSDKKLAQSLGPNCIYKIQSVIHGLPYKCSEPDFLFAMLKIGALINQKGANSSTLEAPSEETSQTNQPSGNSQLVSNQPAVPNPNEGVGSSQVFGASSKTAIESHIEASQRRDVIRDMNVNTSSRLTPDSFRDILGR